MNNSNDVNYCNEKQFPHFMSITFTADYSKHNQINMLLLWIMQMGPGSVRLAHLDFSENLNIFIFFATGGYPTHFFKNTFFFQMF